MIEHGEYTVLLVGNIIETKLKGSFNEYGALAYKRVIEQKVKEFQGKPFMMLVDDLALEGATPEAYDLMQEYTVWLSQQAMKAKACLVSSMAQKEIMLQRAPALKEQNVAFFKDRESALEWLNQQP
ncbi:MAG: hypothetical protein QF552_10525 [Litorilituus sp.]|jgi:hypothetical protein|nr:hypothetical protein [Litorilituus sp.]